MIPKNPMRYHYWNVLNWRIDRYSIWFIK